MIKGYTNYFTMFGMMLESINRTLHNLFNQAISQIKKYLYIQVNITKTKFQETLHKNKTYQGN